MINQSIVDAFLARKLDSFDYIKEYNKEEILSVLNELELKPQLDGLWLHQLVCFLLILELKRFMIFVDMGGGKSLISLTILRYRKQRGDKPKAIVFVPYITSIETWIEETAKHAPDLKCVPLYGTTEQNYQDLTTQDGDLFVMCYASAVAMLGEKRKKPGKKKLTINPEFVRKTFTGFDTLICDEIHRCKSHDSLTYRICRAISAQSEYVVGLTGTPFGRDLLDLWPQFNLIDFGETLGETLGLYREAFFTAKSGWFGGTEYKFKKKLLPLLKTVIKNRSIRYSIDEFADMPEMIRQPIHIKPHDGILNYSTKAIAEFEKLRAVGGSYQELNSEYLKIRQLASGFMTFKGEDDSRVQIAFDENPKLDALQQLIEDMPFDSKMVVFHHFIYTNKLISERLDKMKVDHARVYGLTKDPINELRRFKTNAKCRVLLLNDKSGSSSLNLQIANYAAFFEQPDSAIDRQQAERRIWRPGQEKRVWIIDLLMNGTYDHRILKNNNEGRDTLRELLDRK
ncbi:MAG TPA: DEAD/DEAH box helicase [Candidatus Angelobacter sp.]|nr:DEAD/DEAH box helicase [Candidatus Angelobacter sp.]